MSLFNRKKPQGLINKPSGRAEVTRYAARPLQFVQSSTASRALVLGLNWRTILLAGGTNAAITIAREGAATHYCVVGGQTVGYGLVPKDKLQTVPEQSYPAALLAGRQHSGDALFALSLSSTEIWVAQTRSGRPSGIDEVLIERNGQVDQLALDWLSKRLNQNPASVIYTDIDVSGTGAKSHASSLASLMTIPAMPADALIALPAANFLAQIKVPMPLLKVAGAVLLLWACNTGYDAWNASVTAQKRAEEMAQRQQNEDPKKVWLESINRLGAGRLNPSIDNLRPLRKSLGELPVNWRGWHLKTAVCKPQTPNVGKQTWSCSANYESDGKVNTATNVELKSSIPQGFTAKFVPTQSLSLEWSVVSQVSPLDVAALPARAHHLLVTASKLQELLPALTDAPKITFTPLVVTPPRRFDGTAIAMPSDVDLPSEAPISLKGPLRTIDALIERGVAAEWRSLTLSYGQISAEAVNLRTSALQVELNGIFYAKN
jgi:hypothetical protein